jgi:hypothetical protein
MRNAFVGVGAFLLVGTSAFSCTAFDEASLADRKVSALFDCNDPAQAFTCAEPADATKRFVCHGTPDGWLKLTVRQSSTAHVIGHAHGAQSRPDLAPGTAGTSIAPGHAGLDCECKPRQCEDVCSGGADGTICKAGDLCSADGICSGGVCQNGAPRCVPGTLVAPCVRTTGACAASTGECITESFVGTTSGMCGASCDDCTGNVGNTQCVAGHCGCATDADCTSDAMPQCNPTTSLCEPCSGAQGEATCSANHGGKHCETSGLEAGHCTVCRLGHDTDCVSPFDPICQNTGGANGCGGCTDNVQCARFGATSECDQTNGAGSPGDCVGCVTSDECPTGYTCVNRACFPL